MNFSSSELLSVEVLEATEEGLDLTEGGVKVRAQNTMRQHMQDSQIRQASNCNKNPVSGLVVFEECL